MKITYIYPSLHYPGGISRVLTLKMNYLADVMGHEVSIITYSQFDKGIFFPLSPLVKQMHFDIRRNTNFEGSFFKKKKEEYIFLKTLRHHIEDFLEIKPQDIVITTTFGLEHKFLYKLKDASKKIGEFHFAFNKSPLSALKNFGEVRHPKDILDLFARRNYINSISGLDAFVLLTKQDMISWKRHFKNLYHIPNPITLETNQISEVKSKNVLAIGRFHHQKGFDYLVRIWDKVVKQHPDWTLKIVGDGEQETAIRNFIKKNDLENNICIIKPKPDVHKEYLDASIYVMTSRFEGLPLVLIEAMHFGLPIVSYDCQCGPSDLVKNETNGYLTPVGDIDKTAEHICELIENPDLRSKFGLANRKKSFNYKVAPIMETWESLFKKIIKQ